MSASAPLAQAQVFVEARRWADALRVLTSTPLDASSADAFCLVGQCHLGLNQIDAVIEAAHHALALQPDCEWAYRLLSLAYTKRNQLAMARDTADKAIRLRPNLWLTHTQRAKVDADSRDITDAGRAAAQTAVRLAPDRAGAHILLGRITLQDRHVKLAATHFLEALRLEPDNAVARNNLAVAQLRHRRVVAATRNFVAALSMDPTATVFADNLRAVLYAWAWIMVALEAAGVGVVRVIVPADSTGRPAALIAVSFVLGAVAIAVITFMRASLGSGALRFTVAAVRSQRWLALLISVSLSVVGLLIVAVIVGYPDARRCLQLAQFVELIGAAGLIVRIRRVVGGQRALSRRPTT
ncbi:tetratricopeptide repeat protein [Allobranchiibius sp. CTAmp26]|uniref:tetratricopeptide repeat protein n=1 Tax=Allobranchiibius sp. CTAmp26 TaxID=2815214 RepID=UPI001AA1B132|nr:tetratricopeptide repeat protein [Allobranchiibius sp. CTAmp26]MBO1756239.1 tetratricopeptide repeat protein [Allobranchiibius sp. CTAmp26]